ncbi:MAE_28990/MAE_18760 family HEPN-like nuclease [Oscillospiraceae bacterium LTW-04]|nr:MAE_28990/MAE_18760 family HEPN-like nuclease [Oscillospiraceae bacterium MB24-C1]
MDRTKDSIVEDINWRLGEIALIKAIAIDPGFSPQKKEIALKYAIPALYSIWEGFIDFSFSEYAKYLNSKELDFCNVNIDMLTHNSFSLLQLHNPPRDYNKQKEFVKRIYNFLFQKFTIAPIPTGSNVNYDQLKIICLRFGISMVPEEKYKSKLQRFLMFRNKLAHGSKSIIVHTSDLEFFSGLVIDLMFEVQENIFSSIDNSSYTFNTIDQI